MVTTTQKARNEQRQRGVLIADLVAAMTILALALIPVAYSFAHDQRTSRISYWHAVAMEIVDGEMEILQAGEWKRFAEGTNVYEMDAASAQNLPAGQFRLTIQPESIRLEWIPDEKGVGGKVVREARINR